MQPYQQASEEMRRQGELPLRTLKTAASLGLGAVGGGIAANKVLPFLSKYIPENLAIKGLNKIDPRFGKFIDKALSNGTTFDEIKDFIGEKISKAEEQKPVEKRNIIQKHSDKLHEFLTQKLGEGLDPLQAGALAFLKAEFKPIIEKIAKENKASWADILESIYGPAQQQAQQPQQQVAQSTQPAQIAQPAQPQPSQAQQPGQGAQNLIAEIQKLQQIRKGRA